MIRNRVSLFEDWFVNLLITKENPFNWKDDDQDEEGYGKRGPIIQSTTIYTQGIKRRRENKRE